MDKRILQREFTILTTAAGWPVDEALEFLDNSMAKAKGGARVLPLNGHPQAGGAPSQRRRPPLLNA